MPKRKLENTCPPVLLPDNDVWISASQTYNYMMNDPLIDWLKYHYGRKSLSRSRYNFCSFIMEQGNIFESKVIKLLINKFGSRCMIDIKGGEAARSKLKVENTFEAMKQGIPFIYSGVLHNDINQTFGIPDLLVRSDWLNCLTETPSLPESLTKISAKNLNKPWHYRVVDIKFATLSLRADGKHVLNCGSFPAYKSQLLIYNWALTKLQGYGPRQVYLLGRAWSYNCKGKLFMGNSCFDRLGVIDYHDVDREYLDKTRAAIKWLKDIRTEESDKWNVNNYPLSRLELYPNMCNTHDDRWRKYKEEIAGKNYELTSLWMVGPANRDKALEAGVYSWMDERCTAKILGITGQRAIVLNQIIKTNQGNNLFVPNIIKNNIYKWKTKETIEFFVDFETVNGVVATLKTNEVARKENILFLIGVGYVSPSSGKWKYKHFMTNSLSYTEESRICNHFTKYIITKSLKYNILKPKCYHWSRAEDNIWSKIKISHAQSVNWPDWYWVDLLKIFQETPITIKGCLNFGLKRVVHNMHKHGMISTIWSSDCSDGITAMIMARKAHEIAKSKNIPMSQIESMNDIIEYNSVDVKVLQEILSYIREHHIK